ncbi:MAG: hypothetical protein QG583_447 [Patescibacteria group bacterium]|nr:hypothetical protein [Patescibacteria group bacterium]
MAFSKPANFIDIFKIGDNINFNLSILKVLYDAYNNMPDGKLLIKSIIIINTSITEAILYDFIENRIRKANKTEKLFEEILDVLRSKKLDKFAHYIVQAEKYDFFDMKNTEFYNAMNSLRKKRNRIHIQGHDWKKPKEVDESNIFDEKSKILSEKVLEKTINTMISKYPRRKEYHEFVKDFQLPWEQHFPMENIVEPKLTLNEARELGVIKTNAH